MRSQTPVSERVHPIGEVRRLRIVGDEQHGDVTLTAYLGEKGQHLDTPVHVEAAGRLIGENQLRVGGERPCKQHPLPLAGRELLRVMVQALSEPEALQQRGHSAVRLTDAEVEAEELERRVVDRRHTRQQIGRLTDVTELDPPVLGGPTRRQSRHPLLVDQHDAVVGGHQGGDYGQQRRLARPAWPVQRDELARFDRQREPVKRTDGVAVPRDVVLEEVAQLKHLLPHSVEVAVGNFPPHTCNINVLVLYSSVMRAGKTARQALIFARAARCYWLEIYPQVRAELRFWRERAIAIPDPILREAAFSTQRIKAGNSEGASAFAVLVPGARRCCSVRLLVAFQMLADYLDTISETNSGDVLGNTLRLHQAIGVALGLEAERDDYYELHPQNNDGGYLATHTRVCRELAMALPSYKVVEEPLRRLISCYVESQCLNHTGASLDDALEAEQISKEIARYPELKWWEVVAAGGSTLAMLALLAAADDPASTRRDAELISSAYYPGTNSLHLMLDSVIDQRDDQANGAANQIDHYGSLEEAGERLAFLASKSRHPSVPAPGSELHAVIVAGMAGYYLAQPEAWRGPGSAISRSVLRTLGPMTAVTALVHRLSRRPRAALQPG